MKRLAHSLMVIVLLAAAVQVSANMVGPRVSWTDAGGAKVEYLQMISIAEGDPLYAGFEYAWFGTLNVEMDTAPIDFVCTGDYTGEFNEVWYQVILYQDVTNLTNCSWSEFNLDLDGAYFGGVDGAVNNWGLTLTDYNILYYADPDPFVNPGEVFRDGITVFDLDQFPADPTADFVITKYPTCIPEPGTCVVLMGGLDKLFDLGPRA